MRARTVNAIKALLRMDSTVTDAERKAVVAAATDGPSVALARAAMDDAFMSGGDVRLLLGIDRSTLHRWIAAGRLEAMMRGGRWYVRSESVRRYMAG